MFDFIQNFIKYWYFRYLLVTELYMVETWERVMIYIAFIIFFGGLILFNNFVVLSGVNSLVHSKHDWILLPPLEAMRNII